MIVGGQIAKWVVCSVGHLESTTHYESREKQTVNTDRHVFLSRVGFLTLLRYDGRLYSYFHVYQALESPL